MKPEPVNLNDYQSLVVAYHGESPRAAIVLAGSFVEHFLAQYIRHFMVDDPDISRLFKDFGPFATFDQRISAGYAFRLIPAWIKDDLVLIKNIRNHFAHSPRQLTLDDAKASEMLAKLSTANDQAFEMDKCQPQERKKLLYLFAVARFVVFAHNTMLKHPKEGQKSA